MTKTKRVLSIHAYFAFETLENLIFEFVSNFDIRYSYFNIVNCR